jgi:hypothetical protein
LPSKAALRRMSPDDLPGGEVGLGLELVAYWGSGDLDQGDRCETDMMRERGDWGCARKRSLDESKTSDGNPTVKKGVTD